MMTLSITYREEFKRDAVALVEFGISQKTMCRDLGISKSALGAWVQLASFPRQFRQPRHRPGSFVVASRNAGAIVLLPMVIYFGTRPLREPLADPENNEPSARCSAVDCDRFDY